MPPPLPPAQAKTALALPGVGTYKPIARAETVRAWQINAHYDMQQPAGPLQTAYSCAPRAALPPVRTQRVLATECSKVRVRMSGLCT